MTRYRIPVVTRTQDNGDGGYTTYAYNSEKEMLAEHPMAEDGELNEQQEKAILEEDDPYENGYIGHDEIVIEVSKNGKARLAGPLSFHAGQ